MRRSGPAGVLSSILLGAALTACVSAAPSAVPPSATSNPIVMVSGRDDHGLLADPVLSLQRAPDDAASAALITDGTFAHVLDQRGEWLQVQSVADLNIAGWINDYYLRDRARRADGGGQVEFVDARVANGEVEILVRPVNEPQTLPEWLPASQLQEVGAQP